VGYFLLVFAIFAPLAFVVSAADLVLRAPPRMAPRIDGDSLGNAPFAQVNLDDWRGFGVCRVVLTADGLIFDAYGLLARKVLFSEGKVTMGLWNLPGEWNVVVPALKKRFTIRASRRFAAKVFEAYSLWERAERRERTTPRQTPCVGAP
jgi:hypothetical protein